MNSPERLPPDNSREWLNRTRSNLVRAKIWTPGVYLEDLCFDAQQAAEKAIKAVMIACDIELPFVHDSALLLSILEGVGGNVSHTVRRATRLTPVCCEYTLSKRRADCVQTGILGRQRVVGGDASGSRATGSVGSFCLASTYGGLTIGRGGVLMARA